MSQGSALLEQLERTKDLYRAGQYDRACEGYERIVSKAFPSAMDVWIDAMYGIAESQRVSGLWDAACNSFARLLRHHSQSALAGRFKVANAYAGVFSVLSLIDIGRHSLMVETEQLEELIDTGRHWASELIEPGIARPMFGLAAALLARNTHGPARAATLLRGLAANGAAAEAPSTADVHMLSFRLTETECDLGLSPRLPACPPASHFAFRWCQSMLRLLDVRTKLERGADTVRLFGLVDRGLFDESIMRYAPDLDLLQRWLACSIARDGDASNAITKWSHAIASYDGAQDVYAHSNPTWHRLLLLSHVRARNRPSSDVLAVAAQVLARLRHLFARPQVRSVLRSRGVGASDLNELDGREFEHMDPTALERIQKAVRP